MSLAINNLLQNMSNINLIDQISYLKIFKLDTIGAILSEIMHADISWIKEYSEYQSGGWWTTPLYNVSGGPHDVVIQDGKGIPTQTLSKLMPFTKKFIDELGLKIMYVRLARLSANSFLWEHIDYTELNREKRYRLHIPLVTNSSALFVIAGQSLSLVPGYLWLMDPVKPHGVCNLHGPDRIHLIIDCYQSESLNYLITQRQLSNIKFQELPRLEKPFLNQAIYSSLQLLNLGFSKAAENNLLQLFFKYSMRSGMSYDLLIDMYKSCDREKEASFWKEKKKIMLKGKTIFLNHSAK